MIERKGNQRRREKNAVQIWYELRFVHFLECFRSQWLLLKCLMRCRKANNRENNILRQYYFIAVHVLYIYVVVSGQSTRPSLPHRQQARALGLYIYSKCHTN